MMLVLSACQSTTPPSWYSAPEETNSDYIQAVGQGRSLNSAKQSALSQINSDLWTQVNSSFSMREVAKSFNDKSNNYSVIDNNINSETANVTFTSIEYTKSEKNDIAYFVQARIKKPTVIQQLKTDIRNTNEQAKIQLDALTHQDPLIWWMANQNASEYRDSVIVRMAMLAALTPEQSIPNAPAVKTLLEKVSVMQSRLLVRIVHSSHDKKSAEFLARSLNEQGIATTMGANSRATHTLKMTSEFRRAFMASSYISTKVTTLSLTNNQNRHVIATQEIISTGNSMSGYDLANEGSERNFSDIINEKGIWSALGLTN
ncbi:LPP20 family lipoprotein [Vibrio porteresiae]|uniref:LPP20 family lipoprotein n=1 Tax=Vibrio porteresiae DSM 19223 TaxID=1123496 RepID=A0ABZ0QEX2_9VIBR|nr:LPP20 family lipoprotein [Vibrio porteresiae]WPC74317.1 LPP20 family lipoprotein [Vibrio porteresiae DSM 19223]